MDEPKEMTKKTAYNIRYAKEKIKRVPLDMQLSAYEELKAAADAVGEKVNTYIKNAISQRMARDGASGVSPGVPGTTEEENARRAQSRRQADDGPGQFPYYSAGERTPQPVVDVSPMEDEKSSPDEHQARRSRS